MEDISKHSAEKTASVVATFLNRNAIVGEFLQQVALQRWCKENVLVRLLRWFRISSVTQARGKSQPVQDSMRALPGLILIAGLEVLGLETFKPAKRCCQYHHIDDNDFAPDDSDSEMEVGQLTGSGERETVMSGTRDVPIRHSAPPNSSRTLDGSQLSTLASSVQDASRPTGSDVWAGAISRLQTQVSLNTSMLESHRQKFQDLEHAMQRLQYEMINITTTLRDVQTELRSKPSTVNEGRHDPGDLDVLVGQVEAVTHKANEVDALKLQLELMRNRMKRLEDQGSPVVPAMRPGTSSALRESAFSDAAAPPPHAASYPPPKHVYHQPLPPMRTASMASPVDSRPPGLSSNHATPSMPILESQTAPAYHGSTESRLYSTESSATMQASSAGSLRSSETLPPPSSLTGWRSADAISHPVGLPPPPPPPGSVRHQAFEPSPHNTGWAAVNATQPAKRPFEEPRPSPYESPVTGSPKRPKLAPIMPRSNYGDDTSYVPSSIPHSGMSESPFTSRSRAASDVSQSQSQVAPTPASANIPGHRFIISTAQADSQESWRPEAERMMHYPRHHGHGHGHGHHGHGRGGGGRGRGPRNRGRRGRGGVSCLPESQELGTPAWEKPDWTGSQISPNGYYHPLHHSPKEPSRGGLVRRSGGVAGSPSDREMEFPATPLAMQGPYDPFTAGHPDSSGAHQTSGSKKTRTKPIRNAEGVLIRKDGRPDMRSVSSANNLRKVHAKKEAEKAEAEGRTPTSARSLAQAGSNSLSEDENGSGSPGTPVEDDEAEDDEEQHAQDHNRQFMESNFPSGIEIGGHTAAERFFPRHDHQDAHQEPDAVMKTEPENIQRLEPEPTTEDAQKAESQMTDVVMREMSEAQAEDHEQRQREQGTRTATVAEANEQQEIGT